MTSLLDALGISHGNCVAVVGAGGKTTLCWRLAQEISARGERAIFTTTTKIWQPDEGVFDLLQIHPHPGPLPTGGTSPWETFGPLGEDARWRTACLASSIDGPPDLRPINGAFMPTLQTKLAGFTPGDICALVSIVNRQSSIVVECDGARGLRIKAPGAGEPAIPPCADVVCVLANLDALGRPLDERIAHRVDRVAQLTHTMPGSIITAGLIVSLLTHREGGLKGISVSARKVAVLTQQGESTPHPDATQLMQDLVKQGFDRAVTISPRAAQPVLSMIG